MPKIVIVVEKCKGCSLCVAACPKGLIKLSTTVNYLGYHPACAPPDDGCTGCALCAEMCPDTAIEVYR